MYPSEVGCTLKILPTRNLFSEKNENSHHTIYQNMSVIQGARWHAALQLPSTYIFFETGKALASASK
jgi:hypothetical protein